MVRTLGFSCVFVLVSLLLAVSLHAPKAYSSPGDPPSGSPAGAVYALPLQQGRADAAPKGNGGTADGSGARGGEGQGGTGSLYRTENNFGSASQVPGAPTAGGGGNRGPGAGGAGVSGAGGLGAGVALAGAGNGDRNGNGGGTIAGQATAAGAGNTSIGGSIALLVAIAAAAAAVGVTSRRRAARDDR